MVKLVLNAHESVWVHPDRLVAVYHDTKEHKAKVRLADYSTVLEYPTDESFHIEEPENEDFD